MFRRLALFGLAAFFLAYFALDNKNEAATQADPVANCWQDLAAEDASQAYRAVWQLVQNPAAAVKLLGSKVAPAPLPDEAKIAAWIKDLENPKFAIRDKANRELELQGELAEPQLQKAMKATTDLETRRRVELLLAKLVTTVDSQEKLRLIRAVEALELVGTDDAKQMLGLWAKGFAGDRLTREAKESLQRLEQRVNWAGGQIGGNFKADDGEALPFGAVLRLGTTRFRQAGHINSRAPWTGHSFSADSTVLASAAGDSVQLWDPQTGKLLRKLDYSAACLAFAPKGPVLALALKSKQKQSTVVLWDSKSGKELNRAVVPAGVELEEMKFHPNAAQLITVAKDKSLRVLDAKSLEVVKTWTPPGRFNSIAYSQIGDQVAYPKGRGILIVNLLKDATIELGPFKSTVQSLAFSPDGKNLATSEIVETGIRLWDTTTGKPLQLREKSSFFKHLVFSPNGTIFTASGEQWEPIALWDSPTGKSLKSLAGSERLPVLAISSDNRWLAAGGHPMRANAIRVWDLTTGQAVNLGHGHFGPILHLNFLPSLGAIATGDEEGVFRLWDATTGGQKQAISTNTDAKDFARVFGADFSRDGKRLATSDAGKKMAVAVWDVSTGQLSFKLPGFAHMGLNKKPVYFTPDGRYLLSWAGTDYTLHKWDLKSGKAIVEHKTMMPDMDVNDVLARYNSFGDAAFTSDGKQLILATRQGSELHIFDVESGKKTRILSLQGPKLTRSLGEMSLSPDGRNIAWTDNERIAVVNDLKTGKMLLSVPPTDPILKIRISPSGRTVGVLSVNQLIIVETASGKIRLKVNNLPTAYNHFAFSEDGRYIVTAMEDTTALVWDLALLTGSKKK